MTALVQYALAVLVVALVACITIGACVLVGAMWVLTTVADLLLAMLRGCARAVRA